MNNNCPFQDCRTAFSVLENSIDDCIGAVEDTEPRTRYGRLSRYSALAELSELQEAIAMLCRRFDRKFTDAEPEPDQDDQGY